MSVLVRSLLISALVLSIARADDDPYLWLEDVESERALDWVREKNAGTFEALRDNALFQQLYDEAYEIMTADERIPYGEIVGDYYFNFWQDKTHVRGIWRRSQLQAFIAGEPDWETVLDVDALARTEDRNWVYKGIDCLGGDSDRCLVELSDGGTDESLYREFDLGDSSFVDAGFFVPEAKSNVTWVDEDSLIVATDWGDNSLTTSGYAREARLWTRGRDLHEAKYLFTAEVDDTLLAPLVYHSGDNSYAFLVRLFADWNEKSFRPVVDGKARAALDIPLRSSIQGFVDDKAILALEQDWETRDASYSSGDIVAYDIDTEKSELVFSPSPKQAVNNIDVGESSLYIALLDNVIGRVKRFKPSTDGWQSQDIELPENGVASLATTSSSRDELFVTYESSIQPTTLYFVDDDNALTDVAALPALYDASGVVVRQEFATSADGTKVPYFLFGHESVLDEGDAPAILYGYGGFLIPILPVYYKDPSRPQHGALAGRLWISRGGVLALSNLRGGGEFGPRWHQSALRENRQRAYDDYFAIAEDMIEKGITSSEKLGALGRSNGGLLLGVALTQRPDLFAALDIGVPLLDMKRYNKLLAGSSWMGEYGNPDVPDDWMFIKKYSPYQNLEEGTDYPKVLFYTSTKDDRVHPGHARKMAAKLEAMGNDFFYYENIEGGHGGTANQDQLAMRTALEYAYFLRMLMPSLWDGKAN